MSQEKNSQIDRPVSGQTSSFLDTEIALYHRQQAVLSHDIFGDLAWEILLELDQAARNGLTVRCALKPKPATARPNTAERYLQLLILLGLVELRYSASGPVVILTDTANQKLAKIFDCHANAGRIGGRSEQLSLLLSFTHD